ncbi:hypothetical protein [Psychrobacillus sp. FSL H8-0510]|uniref:hypothetical protein n=1 Tax=Psychrobacillus sp. FSL H8-0510 TaxID=2921394 RepID=UPI0030F5BC58
MENEQKANEVFIVGDKKFTNEDEATRYEMRHKKADRVDFFADLTDILFYPFVLLGKWIIKVFFS